MKLFRKCLVVFITFFSFALKTNAIAEIKLSEGNLSPLFDNNIYKYNVYVEDNVDSLEIYTVNDESDEYVSGIGNIIINDGINEVILKDVKKDGLIITYQINIFKNYKENNDMSNATLDKLEIYGHEIDFENTKYEYLINIENENRLNINYEQTSLLSNVKIIGNSNFKSGENIVKIIVTSKDEVNSNIYIIRVNNLVEEEHNNKKVITQEALTKKEKNIVTITIISICTIFLTFIYYLLFKRKH